MITRSETSTNQSGSAMNRPGSAAQSGSEMNRSGSLRTYLIMEYGEQTQRLVKDCGKELDRQARFANHHHFNLRCVKSGIVPSSLCGTVFSTIPAGLPGPGALSLGYSFALFIFAEEAQYNLARNVQLKSSETGVLGTRKIGTGEYCCVTRVQF